MQFVEPSHGDLSLQRIWCDGPNLDTNPGDVSLWSRILFSQGSLHSTVKKVNNPTPNSFC